MQGRVACNKYVTASREHNGCDTDVHIVVTGCTVPHLVVMIICFSLINYRLSPVQTTQCLYQSIKTTLDKLLSQKYLYMFSAKLPSKILNMSLFLFNIIQTYNIIGYCLHVKEHSVAEYGCGVVAIHVAQHKVPTYFGRPYYIYKNIYSNKSKNNNYVQY